MPRENVPEGFTRTRELEARAAALVASRTTEQLLREFEMTDSHAEQLCGGDKLALAKVRGWIMDALEARSHEAFIDWLDDENMADSPRKYFEAHGVVKPMLTDVEREYVATRCRIQDQIWGMGYVSGAEADRRDALEAIIGDEERCETLGEIARRLPR